MSEWISVEDRMPEECEDVLVYASWERVGMFGDIGYGDGVKIGWNADGHWHIDGKCRVRVTHWMPMPEPPRSEGVWGGQEL